MAVRGYFELARASVEDEMPGEIDLDVLVPGVHRMRGLATRILALLDTASRPRDFRTRDLVGDDRS